MQDKSLIWIFSKDDFRVKDILEVSDYTIVMDDETNGNSKIVILRKTNAIYNDIVGFKKNGIVVYFGIIKEISNSKGTNKYTLSCKYITNIFDRTIPLGNENITTCTAHFYKWRLPLRVFSKFLTGKKREGAMLRVYGW